MFNNFAAAILVVAFSLALSGCQTNVNTMPNAIVMVDSGMTCATSEAPSDKQ